MGKRFVIRIHPSGIYSKLNMRIRFSLLHNLLNGLKLDTLQPKHVISRIAIKKGLKTKCHLNAS